MVGSHGHVAVAATGLGDIVVNEIEPGPALRLVLGIDSAVGAGLLRDGIRRKVPLVVLEGGNSLRGVGLPRTTSALFQCGRGPGGQPQ